MCIYSVSLTRLSVIVNPADWDPPQSHKQMTNLFYYIFQPLLHDHFMFILSAVFKILPNPKKSIEFLLKKPYSLIPSHSNLILQLSPPSYSPTLYRSRSPPSGSPSRPLIVARDNPTVGIFLLQPSLFNRWPGTSLPHHWSMHYDWKPSAEYPWQRA